MRIGRVNDVDGKMGAHFLDLADGAGGQQVLNPARLRVEAIHETFQQFHAMASAGRHGGFGFLGRNGDGLLAQHVLSGLGRLHDPLGMQGIRQRDVDGIDGRVGEDGLIASVNAFDTLRRSGGFGLIGIAAAQSHDPAQPQLLNGRDDDANRYAGAARDSPI